MLKPPKIPQPATQLILYDHWVGKLFWYAIIVKKYRGINFFTPLLVNITCEWSLSEHLIISALSKYLSIIPLLTANVLHVVKKWGSQFWNVLRTLNWLPVCTMKSKLIKCLCLSSGWDISGNSYNEWPDRTLTPSIETEFLRRIRDFIIRCGPNADQDEPNSASRVQINPFNVYTTQIFWP